MIIEKEKLTLLLRTYLPHANETTLNRIADRVENDANKAILGIVWQAVEEEEKDMYLH